MGIEEQRLLDLDITITETIKELRQIKYIELRAAFDSNDLQRLNKVLYEYRPVINSLIEGLLMAQEQTNWQIKRLKETDNATITK